MSAPLTSFERAARLFKQAEKLGCDTPTEAMIAEAIQDAEFDALHQPEIIAERHGGQETALLVSASRQLRETDAESIRLSEENARLRQECAILEGHRDVWRRGLIRHSQDAAEEIERTIAGMRQPMIPGYAFDCLDALKELYIASSFLRVLVQQHRPILTNCRDWVRHTEAMKAVERFTRP